MKKNQTPAGFYDSLADEYDEMTGFEVRFAKEEPIFRSLVKKYGLKKVLDAGSGTGFHSIILAGLGLEVIATDISKRMISILRRNARKKQVKIKAIETPYTRLYKKVDNNFDALFCLGNSICHITNENLLLDSLEGFHRVLKKGGKLFIQMLNYDRILKYQERIQSIKRSNGKIFIRFYDYLDDALIFNVLVIESRNEKLSHLHRSTRIYPWHSQELIHNLKKTGYHSIKLLGSLSGEPFKRFISKDLIAIAER